MTLRSVSSSSGDSASAPAPASSSEALCQDLEQFGLNGYEARALLALLRLGSAPAIDIARVAGLPRTAVYPVLQELAGRGLLEQVPGKIVQWVSPGRDEVLDRLFLAQQERLNMLQARMEQTRRSLERLGTENDPGPLPYLHFVYGSAQARRLDDRLMTEAEQEVVVFNLPPYSWPEGKTNSAVTSALRRGVRIRGLYQESALVGPGRAAFRGGVEDFLALGVEARVVDEIPAMVVVADRRVALLGSPEAGGEYPTILHVEHPGIAAMQAAAFDRWWESSRPYVAERYESSIEPEGHGSVA